MFVIRNQWGLYASPDGAAVAWVKLSAAMRYSTAERAADDAFAGETVVEVREVVNPAGGWMLEEVPAVAAVARLCGMCGRAPCECGV